MTPIPAKDPAWRDRLLGLDKVAETLGGISVKSVRRLILRGELPPAVKVVKSPQLYESDVIAYLERLKTKRGSQRPYSEETDEEDDYVEELKGYAKKALDALEKGNQVAVYNLLKLLLES